MAIILRGTEEIIPEGELRRKLENALKEGRPLRVKMGFDPTAPDIHLGHTIGLRKLRQFQELDHQVVLIVGSFTAMIGDPSGRSATRPKLSHSEVMEHAKTYMKQFFKIVDENKTEVRYNGDWFSKMNFEEVMEKLASKYTVARLLERDDFAQRFKGGSPISLHEMFYPLMQGWDSVEIEADVEIGGTDQKFNMLVGRDLQREAGQVPQAVLTLPILEGTDGTRRMSKSLGNYIGIDEPLEQMFGKIMSIPDPLIRKYFERLTGVPMNEVDALLAPGKNPRDAKRRLGIDIVDTYHGAGAGEKGAAEFDRVFAKKELPSDIPEVELEGSALDGGKIGIARLVQQAGLASSFSDARRLVLQGGVRYNEKKVSDEKAEVNPADGDLLQVGKRRFARLKLK